jgi:hypothetical protein
MTFKMGEHQGGIIILQVFSNVILLYLFAVWYGKLKVGTVSIKQIYVKMHIPTVE